MIFSDGYIHSCFFLLFRFLRVAPYREYWELMDKIKTDLLLIYIKQRKTKTERSGFIKICKEEMNLEKPASDTGVFVFHHVERVSDMLKHPIL